MFGIHKAFRKKKDTIIPGVDGYRGGSIHSPITGKAYFSDGRGEQLHSKLASYPGLQDSNVQHNVPAYAQNTMDRYNVQGHGPPQLKGHYKNNDVKKVDADILVLSQAVSDMSKTLQEAEKTAPHLIEANKPLLDAFNQANEYAMREGFSMDQFAVNDRLDKYGYQDSSSKLGAMVELAHKRVGTYVDSKVKEAQLADQLKTSHTEGLRKDISSIGGATDSMNNSRKVMLDTIGSSDKQQADNLNQTNLQNIQNTSLHNKQSNDNINSQNLLRNKDANTRTQTQLDNEKLKLMKNDLFSRTDNEMYNNLLRAKGLQDAMYRPEQRIKNGMPKGIGARLARGVAKVGAQYVGGIVGTALTKNIPW